MKNAGAHHAIGIGRRDAIAHLFSIFFIFSWISLVCAYEASAQVFGPSVEERTFSLEARFISKSKRKSDWNSEADTQLSHLFGVFHSPKMIRRFRLDPDFVGGIGAPQLPISKSNFVASKRPDGRYSITYKANGKVLLHEKVARALETSGMLEVPLPVEMESFYLKKCTDTHYSSFGDFWYFYDPFKNGCESLSRPPLAETFVLNLGPSVERKLDMDVRLDLLRGANDNGDVFRVDVIHGFESSSRNRRDDGRINFNAFQKWLKSEGFSLDQAQAYVNRPLNFWTKEITLRSGKVLQVEIRSLLVETAIGSRTRSFAKFIKEAVENADVIYYAGHSGLGGNLDIPSLESKVGGFRFASQKRQVFFFESCSSYSYYLDPFRSEKTRKKIDIITNGLSSYFDTGNAMLTNFLASLLDPSIEDTTWDKVLGLIEKDLYGRSYLTNVGGI